MDGVITIVARAIRVLRRVYSRKGIFLLISLAVFLISLAFLAHFDMLPDPSASGAGRGTEAAAQVTLQKTTPLVTGEAPKDTQPFAPATELPVKIVIPAIHLSKPVVNPDTTNIALLDKALRAGAVRYPLSARLGERGNVIIFGHSSYLPFANPLYKTFDGIQKLAKGDSILVSASARTYVYAVDTVSKESATSAAIPLTVPGKELTLSTCDSFGKKTDRFIVTAHLVDSYPVGS